MIEDGFINGLNTVHLLGVIIGIVHVDLAILIAPDDQDMDRDKEAFSDQDKEKNLEASSDQEEESEKEEDTEEVPLDRKGEPVQTEASAASDREEEIPDEPCQESDEEETEETGYDNGSGREEALDSIQAENQNDRPSTRTQSNEEREERPVVRVAARPPRTNPPGRERSPMWICQGMMIILLR